MTLSSQSGTRASQPPNRTTCRWIEFDQLPSTNAHVLEHLHELRHGDIVLAHVQTAGRGRLRRRWISHHPGNIALSIVLKPAPDLTRHLSSCTHYLAVTLCEAFQLQSVSASIKWPNDIHVDGRKIAGILSEARFHGPDLLGCALGIGVNLNLPESALAEIDQPATALNLVLARPIDRDGFLHPWINRVFDGLQSFLQNGFESIRNRYERHAGFLGKSVAIQQSATTWTGLAHALDSDGALWLQTDDGGLCRLHAGDLSLPTSNFKPSQP